MTSQALMVELLDPKVLRPHVKNARQHPPKQIKKLVDSIRTFGFLVPVLLDSDGTIIAGHGRVQAALRLKLKTVPCIRVGHLDDAQIRAYMIADNAIAGGAEWDEELLAAELQHITMADVEFDVTITGFDIGEIDALIESQRVEESGAPEDDVIPANNPRRCNPGDLFKLGNHRLLCADSRNPDAIDDLMNEELAEMAFCDPPYNVPIDGHVSGHGAIKHREFAMASGEMSPSEFTAFLKTSFERICEATIDGAICFICMDWRHIEEIMQAGKDTFSELKNVIAWVKDNGGMGTFYRSRHELIFAFKNGEGPHINSFELGQHGRYRTNVWNYPGVNTFKEGRLDELAVHPTVKPVQMIADAIKDVSHRGGIVLDLFAGSGSTVIAAHKTGRRAYVIEIDPLHCDQILERWEKFAKDDAELIACGFPRHLPDEE